MEQKKTLSELYEECKKKQEMEQQKKDFMKKLGNALNQYRFSPPPIPQFFQGKV